MNYNQFREEMKERIIANLPDDFKIEEIYFTVIRKLDSSYEGLVIRRHGENKVPILDMFYAYSKYIDGADIDDIAKEYADVRIEESIASNSEAQGILDDPSIILNFEAVKGNLMPRLVNSESNCEILQNCPHRNVEDLSIMYTIRIECENNHSEAVVNEGLLQEWGVEESDLYETAMRNLEEKCVPVMTNLADAIHGFFTEETFEPETTELREDFPIYVLSNREMIRGAIVTMCDKIMSRITKAWGDVYVIPMSIHEVMIIPKKLAPSVSRLREMVTDANNTISPTDVLSGNIYSYDSALKSLRIAN